MSAQTWTVDVDGKPHTITVDHDWQTRRATIRVDGRMAVKPLGPDENERDVPVGFMKYVIRRLENDTFDLDIPPENFLEARAAGAAPGVRRTRPGTRPDAEESGGGRRISLIIGSIILVAIVTALVRYGRQGFQYMRVPWQPYAAADGTFKAKFPSLPKEEVESQNIGGEIWSVRSLYSEYKNHFYAVQHIDLKIVVVDANAQSIMERFFEGWLEEFNGRPVSTEKTSLARNHAMNFTIAIPAGAGTGEARLKVPATMRGFMAIRDRRLFLVWTLAAESDPFSRDLSEFVEGFELPPPPERPRVVM